MKIKTSISSGEMMQPLHFDEIISDASASVGQTVGKMGKFFQPLRQGANFAWENFKDIVTSRDFWFWPF